MAVEPVLGTVVADLTDHAAHEQDHEQGHDHDLEDHADDHGVLVQRPVPARRSHRAPQPGQPLRINQG